MPRGLAKRNNASKEVIALLEKAAEAAPPTKEAGALNA